MDVIVPRKRNYFIETIYSHYAHTVARRAAGRNSQDHTNPSDYLPALTSNAIEDRPHVQHVHHAAGCFISTVHGCLMILQELVRRIDSAQYDAFNARYPGRISEMLLDVIKQQNVIRELTTESRTGDWY